MENIANSLFYIVIFIVSFILIETSNYTQKGKGFFVSLGLLIPIILGTFRYQVGTDYDSYNRLFNSLGILTFGDNIRLNGLKEILFFIINKIGYYFGSFNLVLFFFSFFTVLLTYKGLKNFFQNTELSLSFFVYLCMFYPSSFNGVRQMLAVAIVFYSYKQIKNRSFTKFLLLILIAMGFHTSTIVAIPLYFLINKEHTISKRKIINISMFFTLAIMFYSPILLVFSSLSPSFQRYVYYLDYQNSINNYDIFFKLLMLFIAIFFRRNLSSKFKLDYDFVLVNIILGFLSGLLGFSSPYLKRIGLFFDNYQIVLMCMIPSVFVIRDRKLLYLIIFLLSIAYFVLMFGIKGFSDIMPYQIKIMYNNY